MPAQFTRETPRRLICSILLTPLLVVGIIILLVWLALHPHPPKFHIQEFSSPGLGQPNGLAITNITFNVTVRNPNRRVWIHYESIDGLLCYKDQDVAGPMPVQSSFNQEPKNTTTLLQTLSGTTTVSTATNQSWTEFMNDRAQGTVIFNLQLTSVIKYRRTIWDLRHHRIRATCVVGVSSNGLILPSYQYKKCN
ncbi:Late embryogenesis abundant (LEA) hydroxyproline-rich glycoprotein family [Melia azedarach]|uniref:Late embryogenesis abundant (LEA) hydroxyproline-rich glycoprotein family n=1 Tax=Melia azedarach TaxID=155640 RepID=A0ACC1WW35_MELAZ|nr:Late embryogenesis abundant (LEA) hydroxyproline-rich glycoprotein family [Melia azedarach]